MSFITLLVTVENKEGFPVVKIAPSSWTPEVRLYNFYWSLVRTKVIVIVINYIYFNCNCN